jgi:hypothetical protein
MTKQAQKYIKENIPYYGKIHGDTKRGKDPLSKKAWVITSEYVRMRDYIKYGYCVSCGSRIENWRMSDPAHFHSFGGNGALSGFNLMNIHMSCKMCNGFRGAVAGHEMAQELEKRYGAGIIDSLKREKMKTVKADDWFYISIIESVWLKFRQLQIENKEYDFPPYL